MKGRRAGDHCQLGREGAGLVEPRETAIRMFDHAVTAGKAQHANVGLWQCRSQQPQVPPPDTAKPRHEGATDHSLSSASSLSAPSASIGAFQIVWAAHIEPWLVHWIGHGAVFRLAQPVKERGHVAMAVLHKMLQRVRAKRHRPRR